MDGLELEYFKPFEYRIYDINKECNLIEKIAMCILSYASLMRM